MFKSRPDAWNMGVAAYLTFRIIDVSQFVLNLGPLPIDILRIIGESGARASC